MCHASVVEWFIEHASPQDFEDKRILEVGSKWVNGSLRPIIEHGFLPKSYVGVDIEEGFYVDLLLSVEELRDYFDDDSFDVVIATELIEHVKDWRKAIKNMKSVLRPRGMIYLSTRSYGFQYHGYPSDYWRYELEDIASIFADFHILSLESDAEVSGIFLKAVKPEIWQPVDLTKIELYCMALGHKALDAPLQPTLGRKILLGLRKLGIIDKVV